MLSKIKNYISIAAEKWRKEDLPSDSSEEKRESFSSPSSLATCIGEGDDMLQHYFVNVIFLNAQQTC